MTPEEEQRIRELHRPSGAGAKVWCYGCQDVWPCQKRRMLNTIEQQRETERKLTDALRALVASVTVVHGQQQDAEAFLDARNKATALLKELDPAFSPFTLPERPKL